MYIVFFSGVILFEMLAGRTAFGGANDQITYENVNL